MQLTMQPPVGITSWERQMLQQVLIGVLANNRSSLLMKIVHDWLFLENRFQLSTCEIHTYLIYSIIFQEQYQLLELVGFHLEEMPMKKFVLVHPWSNFTALLPFMVPQLHTQWRLNWQNYWDKMVLIQFKKLLEWTTDIVKCSSCNKKFIDNS